MNIAVILARSGSKRIKNKNIKIFYGKPIISQVIQKLKRFIKPKKVYCWMNLLLQLKVV